MFLDIVWPKTRLGLFVTEDECFNILPGSARYQVFENHFKLCLGEDNKRPILTTRHRTAVWVCYYTSLNYRNSPFSHFSSKYTLSEKKSKTLTKCLTRVKIF